MVAYTFLLIEEDVLSTYQEGKVSSEVEDWKGAINEEMNSIHKNFIRELVNIPKEKKANRYK